MPQARAISTIRGSPVASARRAVGTFRLCSSAARAVTQPRNWSSSFAGVQICPPAWHRERRVLEQRAGRRDARLEGGRVDHRLERRTRLPPRLADAVELAVAVVAAADVGAHGAGRRLERDQRALEETALAPRPFAALLERPQPFADRALGGVLVAEVEGREDGEPGVGELGDLEAAASPRSPPRRRSRVRGAATARRRASATAAPWPPPPPRARSSAARPGGRARSRAAPAPPRPCGSASSRRAP